MSTESRDTRGLLGKLFGKGSVAALLLAVFLISGTAWAQYKVTVFGAVRERCVRWTQVKNVAPPAGQRSTTARLQLESWLGGYMTAYSLWVEKGEGPVSEGHHLAAIAWIDNYCHENPLEFVAEAAEQLIFAIKAK